MDHRRSPQQQKRVRQSLRRFMADNFSGTANRSTFDQLVRQMTIPKDVVVAQEGGGGGSGGGGGGGRAQGSAWLPKLKDLLIELWMTRIDDDDTDVHMINMFRHGRVKEVQDKRYDVHQGRRPDIEDDTAQILQIEKKDDLFRYVNGDELEILLNEKNHEIVAAVDEYMRTEGDSRDLFRRIHTLILIANDLMLEKKNREYFAKQRQMRRLDPKFKQLTDPLYSSSLEDGRKKINQFQGMEDTALIKMYQQLTKMEQQKLKQAKQVQQVQQAQQETQSILRVQKRISKEALQRFPQRMRNPSISFQTSIQNILPFHVWYMEDENYMKRLLKVLEKRYSSVFDSSTGKRPRLDPTTKMERLLEDILTLTKIFKKYSIDSSIFDTYTFHTFFNKIINHLQKMFITTSQGPGTTITPKMRQTFGKFQEGQVKQNLKPIFY